MLILGMGGGICAMALNFRLFEGKRRAAEYAYLWEKEEYKQDAGKELEADIWENQE